ncbi:MAG: NB-ARC domain-containing protein, partial [Candidatus Zixiibacteriota bacterium]
VSAALAGIPILPNPYFAHPYPMQKNFTGRETERKELTEWFTNKPEPMVAYIAMGGMGKSALTWSWLHEDIIKKGLSPEGIIWWSFYDKEARFETFLVKAIQYAGKGQVDLEKTPSTRDRMECLYNLLRNNRFLLVLDGVERVLRAYAGLGSPYQGDEVKEEERQDFRECVDEKVGSLLILLSTAKPKTKTLVTSRLCPQELDEIGGCHEKRLKEMSKEDAVDFFQRQGVKGTRAEIESACEPFGYHPLGLRLLSGMIMKDPKFQGDIEGWTRHTPIPELTGTQRQHHILKLSYDSLDSLKQTLISKLSAFRNPMEYDSILIFNEFKNDQEFDKALIELQDRGLLLRDDKTNRYDFHPIVRRYCYDKLLDKKGVHSQLRDYFAKVPKPVKVESLDDLEPVIELYHHTVSSGKYDEAFRLFQERIADPIYYQFGAYELSIDLLHAIFPDGEDKLPKLKKDSDQAWTLNELANSYALSGQSKKAVPLLERQIAIRENQGVKKGVAIGLCNLADDQMKIGDLDLASSNLQRLIEICIETEDEYYENVCHRELSKVFSYQGVFEESEKELEKSAKHWKKVDHIQAMCLDETYRVLRSLLISNTDQALKSAKRARELADDKKVEADIIWSEWLLGAAHLAKGDLAESEKHLGEALKRDRRINLVELEPDILLELAKLRFKQGHSAIGRSASGGK